MYDLDLFSGVGGWGVATEGVRLLGVELDDYAVATSRAAGHHVAQDDVSECLPMVFWPIRGLVASPPCQTFSESGNRTGRSDLELVLQAIRSIRRGEWPYELISQLADPRTALVLEPLRYTLALRPDWLAWEQVPSVLPIWTLCGRVLAEHGYHFSTGVLHAEQYGVPQYRRRAVLIANRHCIVTLPEPTHLFPISMRDAIGWGFDVPAPTITAGGTKTGGWEPIARAELRRALGRRLTIEEAAILQTFPPDYPWRGKKGRVGAQIGNAIPPLLAKAVVQAAQGCT